MCANNRRPRLEHLEHTIMASHEDQRHFLKMILEETIHVEKLIIPEEFSREYLNDVSVPTKVILQVPSGIQWVAELSESNGTMWLLNGWKKFAEDLSLKHGHYVMFRYDGGCNFRVFVFDKSCEIKYPSSCRKRDRSSSPLTQPSKNRRTHSPHHENEPKTSSVIKRRREINKAFKHGEKYHPGSYLKSDKPHFKVEIPSDNAKELNIPTWFASKHLSRTGDVQLRVSGGRTWTVALSCSPQKPLIAKFIGLKWRAFVRSNNLQEGDVCVFDMIKSNVFKVGFLSTSGGKSSPQGPFWPEKSEACENTSKSVKENPSFTKTIHSTVDKYMYIPAWFANQYLSGNDQVKLRVSDGRTWTIVIAFAQSPGHRQPLARFYGDGWKLFVRNYNLQVGGLCVFKLIKGEELVLDVSFSTSSGGKSHPQKPPSIETQVSGSPSFTKIIQSSGGNSLPQKPPSLETQQVCGIPSFTKIIKSSSANKQMRVPVEFTDKHITRDINVILEVEGRLWEVGLMFVQKFGIFSSGWPKFARDNDLRAGDVCVFKLIEDSDVVRMKVSINKH